jgi:hypothetical protein
MTPAQSAHVGASVAGRTLAAVDRLAAPKRLLALLDGR